MGYLFEYQAVGVPDLARGATGRHTGWLMTTIAVRYTSWRPPVRTAPRGLAAGASTEPALDEATKADAKERRASLILENPTVLEVLNSYVLAHGAATWRLSWCGEMRDVEHAQLELMTFFRESAAVAGKGCRP
jgi:hypothetical protein